MCKQYEYARFTSQSLIVDHALQNDKKEKGALQDNRKEKSARDVIGSRLRIMGLKAPLTVSGQPN